MDDGDNHLRREKARRSCNDNHPCDAQGCHGYPPNTTVVPAECRATGGEPKYGTYLRRKKDKIIVMAGLEKNMAVDSPSGNLHKNMMALL